MTSKLIIPQKFTPEILKLYSKFIIMMMILYSKFKGGDLISYLDGKDNRALSI